MLLQANVNWFRYKIYVNNRSKQLKTKIWRNNIFFLIFVPTVHVREVFLPYFFCPFYRFSILVFLTFSFIFSSPSLMPMKAYTVCARAQASIFIVFWPFSPKKIAKLLKKSERWPNKWSKVKTLEDKPRSEWPPFFTINCVRNIIEKAVRICVIIPQNRKVKKKFNFTLSIRVSSTMVWGY